MPGSKLEALPGEENLVEEKGTFIQGSSGHAFKNVTTGNRAFGQEEDHLVAVVGADRTVEKSEEEA